MQAEEPRRCEMTEFGSLDLQESISLEEEVAALRFVYITTKSDLMNMYRRSVIEDLVITTGLKTSLTPHVIIDIAND